MQESKGTTISFIFCDQFMGDLIEKSKINDTPPVTGQCYLSSRDFFSPKVKQDSSEVCKKEPEGIWFHPSRIDEKGEWVRPTLCVNGQEVKPRLTEEEFQTHKVRPKPEDNWKGYCRERYIRPESNSTQNLKLEKCDECAKGAKKICNCGYFKATSIYKPKASKLENSYYQILAECAKEFKFKNELYGDSVFQVRESSLVDKLYAKAKRVITLSKDGVSNKGQVGESIAEDLKAIINYTLIILVLLQKTEGDKCLEYNNMVQKCIEVAEMKDADYGSAWKEYRVETLLDEVFVKVYRLQSLIASKPKGYEDNYFDLINYAIFSLIKLR